MIVDFQHHYHPRSLHESALSKSLAINKTGKVPTYFAPDALFDLDEHIRVMDLCGIDAAVLSSGLGMDGAPLELCRHVNGAMHDAVRRFPKRFFGLAHVPPLGGTESFDELARCAVELGFSGVVVTSEVEGLPLDAPELDPYWAECEKRDLYVFVHPALRPTTSPHLHAYDLVRSIGREFSLATTVVRLIDGGVLDRFPNLKIQLGHLGGSFAVLMDRIRAFHQRERLGTANDPINGRLPDRDIDHYTRERLYYDTAGVFGSMVAVKATLGEVPASQVVLGTDYPLELHTDDEMCKIVKDIAALGSDGDAILSGSAKKLLKI